MDDGALKTSSTFKCSCNLRWVPTSYSDGVCDPRGSNLGGWKVSTSVGWCPLPCGPKTSYSKHVGFFVSLALLVLGCGSMCCPNIGAEFRRQYPSHMMSNLGWGFFPLGQGDGCAQLDWIDLGKKLVLVLFAP